jgi:methionyl-tRNA synthetase
VRDTDFSWREFQARNNNELADILGNFVNRTMTFASKYFDAKVPEMGETSDLDDEMLMTLKAAPAKLAALLERYQVKKRPCR